MAARINKIRHDEETRARIQTTQLVNRLTDHALGLLDLSQTQIKAIEILLRKRLPDLQAVAIADSESVDGRQILGWLDDGDVDTVSAAEAVSPISQPH